MLVLLLISTHVGLAFLAYKLGYRVGYTMVLRLKNIMDKDLAPPETALERAVFPFADKLWNESIGEIFKESGVNANDWIDWRIKPLPDYTKGGVVRAVSDKSNAIPAVLSAKNGMDSSGKICPVCQQPVNEAMPWWTGNPSKKDSLPLHPDCAAKLLFKDEEQNDTAR